MPFFVQFYFILFLPIMVLSTKRTILKLYDNKQQSYILIFYQKLEYNNFLVSTFLELRGIKFKITVIILTTSLDQSLG